jgi:hypothetical protein
MPKGATEVLAAADLHFHSRMSVTVCGNFHFRRLHFRRNEFLTENHLK